MTTVLLYAFLTTAAYYLFARALITKWLWSRYPGWLDKLAMCAACSGFWLGLGAGTFGWWRGLPFLGLPPNDVATVICVGFCSMVWTPLLAYLQLVCLEVLGGDGNDAAE